MVASHGFRNTPYNSPGSHADINQFERGHHYCLYPYHSLASGQTTGREHNPHPLTENWIKYLLSIPCPSEQDPDSATASPSQQEAVNPVFSSPLNENTFLVKLEQNRAAWFHV